jgi:hypothetical protein
MGKEQNAGEVIFWIFTLFIGFFLPVKGLFIAVGASISLDTFLGVYFSIRSKSSKFSWRRFMDVFPKILLYTVILAIVHVIDVYAIDAVVKSFVPNGNYVMTLLISILFMIFEFKSSRVKVEKNLNIDIWNIIKGTTSKLKAIRTDLTGLASSQDGTIDQNQQENN